MLTQNAPVKSPHGRVGYIVKRYPRFSETFIVNEILAHEASGLDIDIFALRPPVDTHFQNLISQVRAPVNYLPSASVKSADLWSTCHELSGQYSELWPTLADGRQATVVEAYQALKLVEHIRAREVTHLHAHFANSAATVARLAARIAGISYSLTMHAKDIFHDSVESSDLESKIADAKFVVTVSDYNLQYLVRNFGHAKKIHRIYNGLDLDLFNFIPPSTSPSRRSRKIIAIGRLVPKKGFSHLIDACRLMVDKNVDFSCEIIGTGELEMDLNHQIQNLALQNHVRLLGPQPQNVVREMIRSAAVLAAPCVIGSDGNRDGLPTVITESLALGTPCVSTDVTGIPEIIRHDETGIIVPQADAVELANALQRVMVDQKGSLALALKARALVEQEFNILENVARIRELFPVVGQATKSQFNSTLQGV